MEGKISIIVPIYNVELYIRKCIDSILAQTYKNLEIILVDDGSPDNCPAICDEYAQLDDRIKVVHKVNGGLSDARNAGIEVATGDYLGFVDSDDWVADDMFEYLLDGIVKYDADISVCNLYYVNKYNLKVNNVEPDIVRTSSETLDLMFSDKMDCYAWNKLFKREIWEDTRYPVGKNFEDMLTIYKPIERANRIAFLEKAKYYYLQRGDSISGKRDYKNRLHIYQAVCDRYEDVVKRHPGYAHELIRRISLYYASELSYNVVKNKNDLYLNMFLLKVLADFIHRNSSMIFSDKQLTYFQRKKLKYLAKGTVAGCKRVLFYRNIEKKFEKLKGA